MILGSIAGDVIGSVYEFSNVKTTDFPLFSEWTEFTDDTVMTLAVADAILKSKDDLQPISYALIESMRELGRAYPSVGYGASFASWLESKLAHPRPYNSWGNGSGMRVSPVAWAFDTLDLVEYVAAESAKVTHNHPEGIKGAQAIAGCAFLARIGKNNGEIREYACSRHGYDLDFTLDDIRSSYVFNVSCQGSVPQAIEAFLESKGFEDAVRLAISIGGDSDTIAAMTCAIAHARYGVPLEIEGGVRARLPEDLLTINDRFCSAYGVGSADGATGHAGV